MAKPARRAGMRGFSEVYAKKLIISPREVRWVWLPPSVLPDISPTGGEIDSWHSFAHLERCGWSGEQASCRSPSLWGRCPAGQRGVSHTRHRILMDVSKNQTDVSAAIAAIRPISSARFLTMGPSGISENGMVRSFNCASHTFLPPEVILALVTAKPEPSCSR